MFCTSCGYKNEDGAAFCVACGADLDEKTVVLGREPEPAEELVVEEPVAVEEPANKPHVICRNCGTENMDTEVYCVSCGADLSQDPTQNPGKLFGILSLVFSLLGLVLGFPATGTCFCPLMWPITVVLYIVIFVSPILGIVFGALGLKKSKAVGLKNPLALAGLIVSIVYLALSAVSGVVSGCGVLLSKLIGL